MVDAAILTAGSALLKSLGAGVFGSVVTNAFALITTKEEHKHELEKEKEKRETLKIEAEIKEKLGNIDLLKTKEDTSSVSLQESYKMENKYLFSDKYVDVLSQSKFGKFVLNILAIFFGLNDLVKSSIRPNLTYFVLFFIIFLYNDLKKQVGFLNYDASYDLLIYICYTVVLLFITAWAWWFSDRLIEKNMLKFGNKK